MRCLKIESKCVCAGLFLRTLLHCCDLNSTGKNSAKEPGWTTRKVNVTPAEMTVWNQAPSIWIKMSSLIVKSTMPKRTGNIIKVKKVKYFRRCPRALSKFLENDMVAESSNKKEQYIVDKSGYINLIIFDQSRKPWFLKRIPKTVYLVGWVHLRGSLQHHNFASKDHTRKWSLAIARTSQNNQQPRLVKLQHSKRRLG